MQGDKTTSEPKKPTTLTKNNQGDQIKNFIKNFNNNLFEKKKIYILYLYLLLFLSSKN